MQKGRGICRISIISMRNQPNHKSDLVNQILFGEHYTVEEASRDQLWLKIVTAYDHYDGWIQREQHHPISEEYYSQIENSDYKICTDIFSSILFNKHQQNILMGSILPISVNELFKMEEQLAFNGESKSLSSRMGVDFIKQTANKYLNTPYLWGGKSPFGIDCSGFTQMVFRISGYFIPRDSIQQAYVGDGVENINEIKIGDLVFFVNDLGIINHVGIALDDQKIIHASGYVRIDELGQEGIIRSETNQLTYHLHSIRRIL